MKRRDADIISLASKLNLDGFDKGPFSAPTVKKFLAQVAQLRQEVKEKATRERVRL